MTAAPKKYKELLDFHSHMPVSKGFNSKCNAIYKQIRSKARFNVTFCFKHDKCFLKNRKRSSLNFVQMLIFFSKCIFSSLA